MDKLSMAPNDTVISGHIGGQLLNQSCYADDMCLISTSSADIQEVLNVCHSYSIEYKLSIMEISHTDCILSHFLSNWRDLVFTYVK